jgi:hypothetical protein
MWRGMLHDSGRYGTKEDRFGINSAAVLEMTTRDEKKVSVRPLVLARAADDRTRQELCWQEQRMSSWKVAGMCLRDGTWLRQFDDLVSTYVLSGSNWSI